MEMKVPHILIPGWPIVLARGDSFAAEGIPHGVRQTTRGTEEVVSKVVGYIKHVLVMEPGNYQAVAFYSSVVVERNKGEHVGIHQDHGCFRSERRKRLCNAAERTRVSRWSITVSLRRRRR